MKITLALFKSSSGFVEVLLRDFLKCAAQKMKFSIMDFFGKRYQTRRFFEQCW